MSEFDAGWTATEAIRQCAIEPFVGQVWRFHKRRYRADDPTGSLISHGRFNRDWPALYVSLQPHIAVGEVLRHIDQDQLFLLRDSYRLTRIAVSLGSVVGCCDGGACRDSVIRGISRFDLCRQHGFKRKPPLVSQAIAAAAIEIGAEALLVPSCTQFSGGNLIVFTANLRSNSRIEVEASEDPELYVDRTTLDLGE